MPFQLVCQPRAALPSLPAPAPPSGVESAGQPPASELSQPLCQSANQSQWLSVGTYDAVGLGTGLLAFVVLKKQLWGSRAVRFITAVALAAAAGAILVAFDPMRADDVARCMHSADYSRFIFLGNAVAVRPVAMGIIPGGVLSWLGCMVVNRKY